MADDKRKKKYITLTIILLIILLAISVTALVALFLHRGQGDGGSTVATVPDNVITPEQSVSTEPSRTEPVETTPADPAATDTTTAPTGTMPTEPEATSGGKTTTLRLNNRQSEDGAAFAVGNMFPGDREAKHYQLEISYHDAVTLNFHADVRSGYEHLAQVLCICIRIQPDREPIYDGPMLDMPQQISRKLTAAQQTVQTLTYDITVYLDTSVGNEYQNASLIADFRWWVTETENLDPPDKTWDDARLVLAGAVALFSGTMLVLFVARRKGKENENV